MLRCTRRGKRELCHTTHSTDEPELIAHEYQKNGIIRLTMTLFDHAREQHIHKEAPLAARMRPRTLDEFTGQDHIVGPGRLLRRAIQADQLSSLIFYGPPGTGKTTLARIIANTTHAHFIALNAVLSGVKDIRAAIETAKDKLGMFGQRTILFIDEVHRFNKAQQDALLPHVENGTVILIGATTENPYFEVNKALVSRSRIFQLRQLDEHDLRRIVHQTLADDERGYGNLKVNLSDQALDHLVNVANGDARGVLNALELAMETTAPDEYGIINISIEVAEESIQQRAVLYDKDGDAHFDTISAFIKSLRGSDPDAALYWMAKMVYAGEDPRFIFRRMLIFAGEDVGMADPQAMSVITAAAQAFEYVGLPEGRFHLSHACLYLATAPKSNSSFAFFDALTAVEKEREHNIPAHLRDGNRDADDFGDSKGYMYPHAYRDHWVAQQYLPDSLQGRVFYHPSDQGYEATILKQVTRRREEQLAAMIEPDLSLVTALGQLGRGPATQNRWLQRTLSSAGRQLGHTRDQVFALADVERHSLILDINAGSGLLTWEAVRRTPAGGVWALVNDETSARSLQQQAQNLDGIEQPVIMAGDPADLPQLVNDRLANQGDSSPGHNKPQSVGLFDIIIGRNVLTRLTHKQAVIQAMAGLLKKQGRLVLAEIVPRYTQRLYRLVDLSSLPTDVAEQIAAAEEAIYTAAEDPMVNWDEEHLRQWFMLAEMANPEIIPDRTSDERHITKQHITRWFGKSGEDERLTYAEHLLKGGVSVSTLDYLQKLFQRQLAGQTVSWETTTLYIVKR
jgi:putative ATPase